MGSDPRAMPETAEGTRAQGLTPRRAGALTRDREHARFISADPAPGRWCVRLWRTTDRAEAGAVPGSFDPELTSRCFRLGIGLAGRHGAQHLRATCLPSPLAAEGTLGKVSGMI